MEYDITAVLKEADNALSAGDPELLKIVIPELVAGLSYAREENRSLKADLARYQDENASVKADLARCQEENAALKAQNNKLEVEKASAIGDRQDLYSAYDKINSKLVNANKQLALLRRDKFGSTSEKAGGQIDPVDCSDTLEELYQVCELEPKELEALERAAEESKLCGQLRYVIHDDCSVGMGIQGVPNSEGFADSENSGQSNTQKPGSSQNSPQTTPPAQPSRKGKPVGTKDRTHQSALTKALIKAKQGKIQTEHIDKPLPEGIDRTCPVCQNELEEKTETVKVLKVIPTQIILQEITTHTLVCPTCSVDPQPDIEVPGVSEEEKEKRAERYQKYQEAVSDSHREQFQCSWYPLIPRSYLSASMAAYILEQDFFMCVSTYRLEKEFALSGFPITRQVMRGWEHRLCQNYLLPIYNRMLDSCRKSSVLNIDETYFHALRDESGEYQTKGYFWTMYSSYPADEQYVVIRYDKSRSGEVARELLDGFQGYLGSDAYEVYLSLGKEGEMQNVLCLAHARRKFYDAVFVEKVPGMNAPEESAARQGVEFFDKIFAFERQYKEQKLSPSARYEARLRDQKPLWDDFREFLNSNDPGEKEKNRSLFNKAVRYSWKNLDGLKGYLKDGRLEATNMIVEHVHRNVATYRNNSLFAINDKCAQDAAIIMSVIYSAVVNGLNPAAYLEWVFSEAPGMDLSKDADKLLPRCAPEECKLSDIYLEKFGYN